MSLSPRTVITLLPAPGPTDLLNFGVSGWKVSVTASYDDAFTSFVQRVGGPLRQALVAAYGPDVGAEVTAEALAYAWEHWDRIGEMTNPAGYLYRVGQSRAKRGVFRKPPPILVTRLPDGSHWFEPGMAEAIAALSEKQRAAVVLVHGYGWTVTEVAEMWGVTFSTVTAHIDRGMSKLRRKLGVEL
jgi:DNA-directed RNA polymerase specialized sigma24 family protein